MKTNRFVLVACLLFLSACSFDVDSEATNVTFGLTVNPIDLIDVSQGVFGQYEAYDLAKLVIRGGPNGEYSQTQQIRKETDNLQVAFRPPGLQVGFPYSFLVFGYDKDSISKNAQGDLIGRLDNFVILNSTDTISIPPEIPPQSSFVEID